MQRLNLDLLHKARIFFYKLIYISCNFSESRQKNLIFFILLYLPTLNILRDFRNAPFYIHCLFNMVNLRMFS